MLKIISKGNFDSIDQFSLLDTKKLGSGSFGTVKLAIHNNTSRMYAIKVISLNNIPSEQQIKLIEREIKLHCEMDHPHIIKVWDTFCDNEDIFMVMEYAEVGNLFYFQNTKNVFTEPQAFKFFAQTLQAVSYLHSNNIIHRDLKVSTQTIYLQPQNLLLDQYHNIKICDFGWCAENIYQKRSTFCGTYEYMAPEMIFHTEYDYRVDIWALGILLYEMLHGFAPFKGKTIQEVQQSMLKGRYDLSPKLSPGVKDLIENILQFKPEKRMALEEVKLHMWMKDMQGAVKQHLKEVKIQQPQEIQAKLCKVPISMYKLKAAAVAVGLSKKQSGCQKKKNSNHQQHHHKAHHRKNNSMNLATDSDDANPNININLSINNFSIVNKKKKRQLHHSQDSKVTLNRPPCGGAKSNSSKQEDQECQIIDIRNSNTCDNNEKLQRQKQDQRFKQFKESLNLTNHYHSSSKLKKSATAGGKTDGRCKTLMDDEVGMGIKVGMESKQGNKQAKQSKQQLNNKNQKSSVGLGTGTGSGMFESASSLNATKQGTTTSSSINKHYQHQKHQNQKQFLQNKKLSKDHLFLHEPNHSTDGPLKKRQSQNIQFSFLKKNLKLRKSQDRLLVDKHNYQQHPVRFNTEAYDKQDDGHQLTTKFKKCTVVAGKKSSKMLAANTGNTNKNVVRTVKSPNQKR